MAKGILFVETSPSSPEREAEYNTWYNETHLPEVCAIEGIVSARRFAPVDGSGPYVAIYELDTDDLDAIQARLGEAAGNGKMHMSDVLQLDPPPNMKLLKLTAEHEPAASAS